MPYRIEYAKTARAGCKASTCDKAKITKGALRFGVWVDTGNFQSWQWRHWGCVTSRVLHNVKEKMEPQEELDGIHELTPADQQKVSAALQQGELDPADQTEPVPKKSPPDDGEPPTPKSKRKRTDFDSDPGEGDAPGVSGPSSPTPPPRKRPPGRERKTTIVEEEDEEEQEVAGPKKIIKRKRKTKTPKGKSKPGRKRKAEVSHVADEEDDGTGVPEDGGEEAGDNADD